MSGNKNKTEIRVAEEVYKSNLFGLKKLEDRCTIRASTKSLAHISLIHIMFNIEVGLEKHKQQKIKDKHQTANGIGRRVQRRTLGNCNLVGSEVKCKMPLIAQLPSPILRIMNFSRGSNYLPYFIPLL